MADTAATTRVGVTTTRHHQRFLLRQMQFSEQFAGMYRVRTKLLRDRVLERSLQVHATRGGKTSHAPEAVRVLGLQPGVPSLVVGTLYKTMKNFVGFLAEYQKELVRIEAGDDDDGEGGGEDMGDMEAEMEAEQQQEQLQEGAPSGTLTKQASSAANKMCSSKDTIVLEDESGRVELAGIDVDKLVTGMVVAVYGTLMEKGRFEVTDLYFPSTPEASVPRSIVANNADSDAIHTPSYVAFVSGLGIGCQGEAPLALGKLLAYLVGDTAVYNNATNSVPAASSIAKVVIGGCLVDATDEHKLKQKVRLEPNDHVRIADTANKLTAANSMKSADAFLSILADSVEVDVMPGDTDPSNAYLPQQPLHPVLLRVSARKPSVRFVTNPYDVSYQPAGASSSSSTTAPTRMFVSSGQNIEDLMRQTNHKSYVETMQSLLECGCACPTAPNTLLCYPFTDKDPFTFPVAPDVMVTCNTTRFETAIVGGVRYVAVPSFVATGELVLVDIASPMMDTISIPFTV